MANTTDSNYSPKKSDLTLNELVAIRQELEHLQDRGLANVWEQIKDLNEQNAALLKEVSLLRKTISDQVAKGFIIGSIVLSIILGLITTCAANL